MSKPTPVYLDYNATAPIRPEVVEAVHQAMEWIANPSSVHSFGRDARARIEQARATLATIIQAPPNSVTFTSGGTEANNLALWGYPADHIVVSAVEHDSVLAPARARAARPDGPHLHIAPVDRSGRLDLSAFDQILDQLEGRILVSVMLANNETGVIQPVREIACRTHAHNGIMHSDAIQAFGKIEVNFNALECDALTLSGHKIGGPHGIGALVGREGLVLTPLITGGGQEFGRRAGTENFAGALGFSRAAELAVEGLRNGCTMADLRDRIMGEICAFDSRSRVIGGDAERLPNTLCVTMPGRRAETIVMALDLEGIAISAGSACSSGKVGPSHVLDAMGISIEEAESAVRISLGWASTEDDIARFCAVWKALVLRRVTEESVPAGQ